MIRNEVKTARAARFSFGSPALNGRQSARRAWLVIDVFESGGFFPPWGVNTLLRSAPQMHNVLAPAGAMKERVTEGTENESAENVTEWPRPSGFLLRSPRQGRIRLCEQRSLGEGRHTLREQGQNLRLLSLMAA